MNDSTRKRGRKHARELINWLELRDTYHYDPDTGVFTRRAPCARYGLVAGSDSGQGYIDIRFAGIKVRAHRLAIFYMLMRWPTHEVDHINGIRSDNRWLNLRELTGQENTHNQRKAHRNGRTGLLGVRLHNYRYRAVIAKNGKRFHLGTFDTANAAHEAYVAAKRVLHASCTI